MLLVVHENSGFNVSGFFFQNMLAHIHVSLFDVRWVSLACMYFLQEISMRDTVDMGNLKPKRKRVAWYKKIPNFYTSPLVKMLSYYVRVF